MISRMAVRGILFLTLFTGMCVADPTGNLTFGAAASINETLKASVEVEASINETLKASVKVEVFAEKCIAPSSPCGRKNLALGAPVVQSSTYDHLVAERAVDGNRNPILPIGSCTQTKANMNPWWRVDLQEEQAVTRVVITNRGDGYAERINGAQIRIGHSLSNNGNNNELAATVESIPPGVTKTFVFKPIKGRYVNIVIPGRREHLTLCEVEVFADKDRPTYTCAPRNLALGAEAVQSSTHINLGAQNAVDGNRNSNLYSGSCSHTDGEMNPWWRVDLLEEQAVSRVSITNRGDDAAERINGAEIRIGNSLDNNGNNNEMAASVGSMTLGETQTFKFNPIKGRYVNIVIPGRIDYLTLCEVEVFAD